ncbi:uncharacterized protein LOC128233035 [Mya arenaria]|uniref:uncharacterized protein LOC128233035 n=1 Tax=Mya arenaria TaxID=6604 RepID=UPI0022E5C565|nr:uncharacterized protein LOC128233035 [Mya arenaria]
MITLTGSFPRAIVDTLKQSFDDACTAVADCSSIGGVTLCTGSKCACGANYATGTAGDFTCLAQVGATCTASGNECWTLAGGYCDTGATSPVCACGKLYTATTTCAVKACTLDSVCTTLDTNSYCLNGNCACKVGYSVNPGGTTGLCELVGSSDAKGVVASMAVLIGSLILTVLHM